MNLDEVSAHLQRDMKAAVDQMIHVLGYRPTAFLRMVADHGAVGAAKRLLTSPNYEYGFEKLYEHHRLEWSVEAHIVLPWYRDLFTFDEILTAETRLALVDFDVEAFVAEATPPAWAAPLQ
jgi:hypothetical protein